MSDRVDLVKPRRPAFFLQVGAARGMEPFDATIKVWRSHGLDCAITISGMMFGFNGYVRLPANSPDRRIAEAHTIMEAERRREDPELRSIWGDREVNDGYDALDDIEIHGGLTYGPDDEGWVGFDTGHAWDDWSDEILEAYIRPRSEQAWQHFLHLQAVVGKDMWPSGRLSRTHGLHDAWNIDWTMERLETEVESLAVQIYARLKATGVKLPNGA